MGCGGGGEGNAGSYDNHWHRNDKSKGLLTHKRKLNRNTEYLIHEKQLPKAMIDELTQKKKKKSKTSDNVGKNWERNKIQTLKFVRTSHTYTHTNPILSPSTSFQKRVSVQKWYVQVKSEAGARSPWVLGERVTVCGWRHDRRWEWCESVVVVVLNKKEGARAAGNKGSKLGNPAQIACLAIHFV